MSAESFTLGAHTIGGANRPFIVAEVAQAHEGSLSLAHAYIDQVAEAGADAVKFQCHIAAAESTHAERWRVVPRWPQDASRYDYWLRMEFTAEQWEGLRDHALANDLVFLCSPFSVQAVELLDSLVPAWKVASGEIGNVPMLEAIGRTGKPVILSTGMCTEAELEVALRLIPNDVDVALLQATSEYPTPLEHVGLNVLEQFRGAYRCQVGLSDHSGSIYAGLAAAAHGASIIEVHVTMSKAMGGFDTSSSIDMADLARLVDGSRQIFTMTDDEVDKDASARMLADTREAFMGKWKRKAMEGK